MGEKIYEIKWKNHLVGTIRKNSQGMYKYIPEIENIQILANTEGMPSTLVKNPQDWDNRMPKFVERRLKWDSKNKKVVTDYFTIESVKDKKSC